jgi:lipopolysaccharide assembly outer membrane protein LptD (OstA)
LSAIALQIPAQQNEEPRRQHLRLGTPNNTRFEFTADQILRAADRTIFKGNVEIRTATLMGGYVIVRADEADFYTASGQIEVRGNVRMVSERAN